MADRTVRIDEQYQGFPGMALGGITGGLLARELGSEVEVTLRRPIATGVPLELVHRGDAVAFHLEGEDAATAAPARVDVEPPAPVASEDAEAASRSFEGFRDHPYPACFTCGTERDPADGLRLFAGRVGDGDLLAAPWSPQPHHAGADGTLPPEYVWAAADCPSIWAVMAAADPASDEHVVTGRLAVRQDAPVRAGERHVVLAWPLDREAGSWPAGAAVYTADGELCAVAEHTLVVTDWGVPLGEG